MSARRERSAPAQGGSRRRKASRRARPAPAANRGSPSPALPLARAQDGTGAGGGNACVPGSWRRSVGLARASERRRDTIPKGGVPGRKTDRDRRESRGHGESAAALCHLYCEVIRPACREEAMSDKLPLSDMIRERHQTHAKRPEFRP